MKKYLKSKYLFFILTLFFCFTICGIAYTYKEPLSEKKSLQSSHNGSPCVAKVTCYQCKGDINNWEGSYFQLYKKVGNLYIQMSASPGLGFCPKDHSDVKKYVGGLCVSYIYKKLPDQSTTACAEK